MTTRREFVLQSAAIAVTAAVTSVHGAEVKHSVQKRPAATNQSIPKNGKIKSVVRRDETILRLGGDGDNFHMSWAADDRQYVSVCDGMGWSKNPKELYNSRLWALTGSPHEARFEEIPGYPDRGIPDDSPKYYNFGTLALDGRIYQFLSTLRRNSPLEWVGAKLIYSPDNGRTWRNQDGSTPVTWEAWERQSRQTMVFFEEPQSAFSLLTVLQMGRNYGVNRDGYVYIYAPNGIDDGTMNELVMCRVQKARILQRDAYEFFAGCRSDGSAKWTQNLEARGIVHSFPRGWVGRLHYAWQPSVAFNPSLGLYMMANWGMGLSEDGGEFGKPSYLGFWVSRYPWGPWTQIHEETAWAPNRDLNARAYQPQISPKWIAADGRSFWLVWTDFQHTSEFNRLLNEAFHARRRSHADFMRLMMLSRRYRPYYAFNTQRVDLVIA